MNSPLTLTWRPGSPACLTLRAHKSAILSIAWSRCSHLAHKLHVVIAPAAIGPKVWTTHHNWFLGRVSLSPHHQHAHRASPGCGVGRSFSGVPLLIPGCRCKWHGSTTTLWPHSASIWLEICLLPGCTPIFIFKLHPTLHRTPNCGCSAGRVMQLWRLAPPADRAASPITGDVGSRLQPHSASIPGSVADQSCRKVAPLSGGNTCL